MKDYQTEFNRLLNEVNLSNENAISCFLGGLKPELNKSVRIQSPRKLMQAYKIARLQECIFEAHAQSWGLKPATKYQNPILPTPSVFKPHNSHKSTFSNSTFNKFFESNAQKTNKTNATQLVEG